MLHAGFIPEFTRIIENENVRPAASWGVEVDPNASANTYGSYVSLIAGASVTHDCYGMMIWVTEDSANAANHTVIFTIGKDESGGSSFTDMIPDVLASATNQIGGATQALGGFYFPVFIKAGTSIGAKTQNAAAALANGPNFYIQLLGSPRFPEAAPYVTKFKSFGADLANTRGTVITPGTAADGAWTEIGTLDDDYWWWQVSFALDSAAFATKSYHVDVALGDASNKRQIVYSHPFIQEVQEAMSWPTLWFGAHRGANGDKVYARAQCSAAIDAGNYSIAIIGAK